MAIEKISKGQAARKSSVDFSKIRKNFQGKPTNYVAFGVVGHYDQNPAYARVENGKVLVEVTLMPGGDEIVAELGQEGQGAGFAFYIPMCIGCRVLVAFPQGEEDPVIIKRLTDAQFPFPTEVGGVSTVGTPLLPPATTAPQWAFLQTPDGQLLAIESGIDGDITVKSGSNMKLEVGAGDAIHLKGRTHIGEDFEADPVGATVGPAGTTIPGTSAVAHVPTPSVPVAPPVAPLGLYPLPSPRTVGLPEDGIARVKDLIQSDILSDPAFFTFIVGLYANPLVGPALVAAGAVQPSVVNSAVRTSSRHTASDG